MENKSKIQSPRQFVPCRICGGPTKYHGSDKSKFVGKVRCEKPACIEASRTLKNLAIRDKAKQMYADGERGLSEEARESIRAKLAGRKLGSYSPDRRAAISSAKKGRLTPAMSASLARLAVVNTGRKPWNKGQVLGPQSQELIEKRVAPLRGRARPEHVRQALSRANKGKAFSNQHKQLLSESAHRLWQEGRRKAFRSKLEIRLGAFVEPLGFVPQFRIDGKRHPYDYGHAEKRVVIEAHGCYWHAHDCGVKQRRDDVKERDVLNELNARESGYQILILWQCQEEQWPEMLRAFGLI